MKKFGLFLSVLFGSVLITTAIAQQRPTPTPETGRRIATATLGVQLPLPPTVEFDIREQPGSPIRLFVGEAIKGRLPGSPVRVRNDSIATVAAYVLRVDVEPYGLNKMVIPGSKGLAVGDSDLQGLPMSNYREGSSKPVVSVDYVQFTDGTTWGEDTLARSKHVAAYLKGRNDAIAQVQEMLAGQDATDINRSFDVFGSSSFGEPNVLPAGRPPRYIDYAARGREEVINILRRMPRNSELGKDLARRLETVTKTPDQ